MASTLRDELASLKIDRREAHHRPSRGGRAPDRGRGLASALLWLIPVGLLGGAGAYAYKQYERIRPKQEVSLGVVQAMTAGEAEKLLTAKGYLTARRQATVAPKVPGFVERMLVEEGTKVKKGQLLAVIQHEDVKATLASRQAMVHRTEAELQESRASFRDKERTAARLTKLRAQNHSSVEELDHARAEVEMAAARISALEATLNQSRAVVRETDELIRNMHVVAPFDGTVTTKDADEGEMIGMGMGSAGSGFVRSAVATVADLDHLDVETDISENFLSRVAPGQPAEIVVSAVPGRRYRGRLRQVIPMGDRTRGTVKVKVEVLDPDDRLFPELVANVHFLPNESQDDSTGGRTLLFVPKAAIVDQGGETFAWVVERERVHKRPVEVLVSTDDLARVESGLKADESVVLNPKSTLQEGETVKVAE